VALLAAALVLVLRAPAAARPRGGLLAGAGPCGEGSGPCVRPVQLYEDPVDWEIRSNEPLKVRKWKATDAPSLGKKWRCTVLRGRREGDWVKLTNEPGFLPLVQDNITTMKPIPVYAKIKEGHCNDVGMYPINDSFTCEVAAKAMSLSDTRLKEIMLVPLPEGCHMFTGARSTGLYLSTNTINSGNGALKNREPICSSYAEPSRRCMPATTTHTTTSTSSTWGWPSLFCVTVGTATGDEKKVLQHQIKKRTGVFGCDEFDVFSAGQAVELGHWAGKKFVTRALPEGVLEEGLTQSSFMVSWRKIKEDGRFRSHDWTVKVSPETVFFPDRLRAHVKEHTPPGGASLFFEKCDRFNPTQRYGLFEVRSRPALDAYFWNEDKCKKELPWQGWVEDKFMQKCLEMVKVASVFDQDLLEDTSCGSVNCWDKSKVAYHDFQSVESYVKCWQHASR